MGISMNALSYLSKKHFVEVLFCYVTKNDPF